MQRPPSWCSVGGGSLQRWRGEGPAHGLSLERFPGPLSPCPCPWRSLTQVVLIQAGASGALTPCVCSTAAEGAGLALLSPGAQVGFASTVYDDKL